MAQGSTEETKEGQNDSECPSAPECNNLVGHWKCTVFMNGTNYYGTHDIEVTRHSSQGVIEAELVGTSYPGKAYTTYSIRSKYVGVMRGDQVTLTYQDAGSQYTASIILKITDYAMDGTWNDSSRKFGTVQWFKVFNLKNANRGNMETVHHNVYELQQQIDGLTAELDTLKRKMTWRAFEGNVFDINKEYRVRMNEGGGLQNVECVGPNLLLFSCSTANHYYGAIEVTTPNRWHYRYKGNSATKVPNSDNGNVYRIEERG